MQVYNNCEMSDIIKIKSGIKIEVREGLVEFRIEAVWNDCLKGVNPMLFPF